MANRLFYGDNLEVLRGRDADGRPPIPDESVDLIYLDPPFNSAATYNVLFRAPDGRASDSQLEALDEMLTHTARRIRRYRMRGFHA